VTVFLSHSSDGFRTCQWDAGTLNSTFNDQASLNGSGYSAPFRNYGVVKIEEWPTCTSSKASSYYRPHSSVVGPNNQPINETTVAFNPEQASMKKYGVAFWDEIAIIGVVSPGAANSQNLVKTVTDLCTPNVCGTLHFDNYTYEEACNKNAVQSLGRFQTILLNK
jgi:hypothetical protein